LRDVPGADKLVDRLPFGASMLKERKTALTGMGGGVLLMAVGASIFALGWWRKVIALVDVAFVVTLIGWMCFLVSFAFWFVTTLARKFPNRFPKH